MRRDEEGSGVKAVDTALDVVNVLHEKEAVTIESIANEIGVGSSTVHRHLVTLHDRGYIDVEDGKYRLSRRFLTHAGAVRKTLPAYELIEQKVQQISEETEERAQFVVEEHGERVYVFTRAGANAVRTDAKIGKRGPLHVSAAGKAILASLPVDRLDELASEDNLEPNTENSIADRETLESELGEIRERGYAFNDEESTEGLRAVGVPIRRADGRVLGAMSITGPAHRLKGEYFRDELPTLLLGTANEIELTLKYS